MSHLWETPQNVYMESLKFPVHSMTYLHFKLPHTFQIFLENFSKILFYSETAFGLLNFYLEEKHTKFYSKQSAGFYFGWWGEQKMQRRNGETQPLAPLCLLLAPACGVHSVLGKLRHRETFTP